MSRPNDACRLYLVLPPVVTSRLEADLSNVIQAADIACLLLSGKSESMGDDPIRRIMRCTQARETAFLVQNDAEAAKRLGADGIHLDDVGDYLKARDILGNGAIIGADSGLSRHRAMTAAEQGADYIAFGAAGNQKAAREELIAWWAELFEVPCVAWSVERIDEATTLANAGADFVALSPEIWNADSPTDTIMGFQAALAAVAGQR